MKKIVIIFTLACSVGCCLGQQRNLGWFIAQARQNSPLIKDYGNQVLINQLDSQRIKATYRPQVNGNSTNIYAPVIAGFGYDGAITNGGQVTALVGINQQLISKKYLSAQFETLRIQNQGLDNASRVSEQDLGRTVTAQYVTVYGDQQQLRFAEDIAHMLRKEDTLLKKLTESNVYRQTDYLTFLVTRQQQDLVIRQLSIQLKNDFAGLHYLCGTMDTMQADLPDPGLQLSILPPTSQSVFFKKFELDSLQLINSKSLVDYSYKPKVSLFADGGYNSTLTYQAQKNFGTSFGFTVSVPIYDGHQRQIQYKKLNIQERTRQGYKDFFTAQYNQQVAQLLQQLNATSSLIGDIEHQIKYAEGLINVNMRLLETGDVKIADLVIAVNNYLTAKNLLTQNNTSKLQIINQINYWNR
ncbi:MAG: TolC family protein [Chitinophagaceae bacterium]